MKVRLPEDNRTPEDKYDDLLWTKLCRKANLNPMQQITVARYVDEIVQERLTEVESAVELGYIIALRDVANFGEVRMKRVQDAAAEFIEKAYSVMSYNGNSNIAKYDGCAIERLNNLAKSYGIEYIPKK